MLIPRSSAEPNAQPFFVNSNTSNSCLLASLDELSLGLSALLALGEGRKAGLLVVCTYEGR